MHSTQPSRSTRFHRSRSQLRFQPRTWSYQPRNPKHPLAPQFPSQELSRHLENRIVRQVTYSGVLSIEEISLSTLRYWTRRMSIANVIIIEAPTHLPNLRRECKSASRNESSQAQYGRRVKYFRKKADRAHQV